MFERKNSKACECENHKLNWGIIEKLQGEIHRQQQFIKLLLDERGDAEAYLSRPQLLDLEKGMNVPIRFYHFDSLFCSHIFVKKID